MNSPKVITAVFLVFLLSIGFASAFNTQLYTSRGGIAQSTYASSFPGVVSNYTAVDIQASGSYHEPIVADLKGDGTKQIIIPSSGVLTAYQGSDIGIILDSVGIGDAAINGVVCDMDNDGRSDYVGVFDNSTHHIVYVLSMSNDGLFSIKASAITNTTNDFGNMVCGRYFQKFGDPKNYVFWLSQDKYLHRGHYSSGSLSVVRTDVSGGGVSGNDEYNGAFEQYQVGAHQLVYSDTADPNGAGAVFFVAGRSIFAQVATSSSASTSARLMPRSSSPFIAHTDTFGDTYTEYNTTFAPSAQSSVLMVGDIRTSPTASQTLIGILYSGSSGNILNDFNNPLITVRLSNTLLGGKSLSLAGGVSVKDDGSRDNQPNVPHWSAVAVDDFNSDGISDIYVATTSAEEQVIAGAKFSLGVYSANNMSVISLANVGSSGSLNAACQSTNPNSYIGALIVSPPRIMLANILQNNRKDIVMSFGDRVCTVIVPGTNFNNTPVVLSSLPVSVPDTQKAFYSPIAADVNNDGLADLLTSTPSITRMWQSTAFGGSINPPQFSIRLNNTIPFDSVVKVTTVLNTSDFNYNYALICDINDSTLWNEQFKTGYNFTTQNVSLNIFPPENYITFNSLRLPIGANYSQFDVLKSSNEGYQRELSLRFSYEHDQNNSMDVLMFADDNQVTGYFRFNKTGTNVQVSKIVFGNEPISLSNTTVSSSLLSVEFLLSPVADPGGDFFTADIKLNGNFVVSTSTAQFTGQDIKDVELFSDSFGNLSLFNLGLFATYDHSPSFVEFQNGEVETIGGVTISTPPPNSQIGGDGYTVIPDYNNVFYGVCSYDGVGTHTQRHFLANNGQVDDYSNYKDITVAISSTATTGEGITEEDAAIGDSLAGFLNSFGLPDSPALRLLYWMVVMIVAGIIGFRIHVILGVVLMIITLIAGVAIGFVPFYVLIILVIICAGIMAMLYRVIFAGG